MLNLRKTEIVNPKIKELAEQAGFMMWTDESWKPHGAVVDWASQYDRELEKFAELIVREALVLSYEQETMYYVEKRDDLAKVLIDYRKRVQGHFKFGLDYESKRTD